MSVGLVSTDEGLICTYLKSLVMVCLVGDFDTAQSHGGYEMPWSLDPADKHV